MAREGYLEDQYRIVENGGIVHVYLRSKVMGARWNLDPRSEDVAAVGKALAQDASLSPVLDLVATRSSGVGYGYTLSNTAREDASSVSRMLAGLESSRSGDVLLLLKRGHYFGNTETGGAQHGSIFAEDLAIPLVIAQGGAGTGRSPVPISTTEIPSIIAAYLGFRLK
jgi:hypothetical protein